MDEKEKKKFKHPTTTKSILRMGEKQNSRKEQKEING